MIKTIIFNGGLGNQMFQYAFYLQLKEKHPFSILAFDINKSENCHAGYQLDEIFNIDTHCQEKNFRIISNYCKFVLRHSKKFVQDDSLKYDRQVFQRGGFFVTYEGFWQSEKYFHSIQGKVRNAFTFRDDNINVRTKELIERIKKGKETYISVHIRRGDYLLEQEQRGICDKSYYIKAIEYIQDVVPEPYFVFFSDDIEWFKKNIFVNNGLYVDWNNGNDSWQDMYMMSLCNHNIIANSSFSWWGAWLNAHTNKIVVAPKQWFRNRDNYDIMPENWIKL